MLESILKLIRDHDAPHSADRGRTIFRTHPLAGADAQTVVSVLQSLLAEEDIRLAPDATSNQIAVLATEDNHALVETTISQLAKTDAMEFKAIPLGDGDLRQTLALLHGIFGITPDRPAAVGSPRIDADPATNRCPADPRQSFAIRRNRGHPETAQPGNARLGDTDTRHSKPIGRDKFSRLAVFYLEHTTAIGRRWPPAAFARCRIAVALGESGSKTTGRRPKKLVIRSPRSAVFSFRHDHHRFPPIAFLLTEQPRILHRLRGICGLLIANRALPRSAFTAHPALFNSCTPTRPR